MFRKIHSNRDPRDTLYRELKKEFGVYFNAVNNGLDRFFRRYTWPVFSAMVFLILLSVILSLTIFRRHKIGATSGNAMHYMTLHHKNSLSPVSDGFSKIMQVGSALRETIALKNRVDSLIAKKNLTKQDSAALEQALDRLQQLKNKLKSSP